MRKSQNILVWGRRCSTIILLILPVYEMFKSHNWKKKWTSYGLVRGEGPNKMSYWTDMACNPQLQKDWLTVIRKLLMIFSKILQCARKKTVSCKRIHLYFFSLREQEWIQINQVTYTYENSFIMANYDMSFKFWMIETLYIISANWQWVDGNIMCAHARKNFWHSTFGKWAQHNS